MTTLQSTKNLLSTNDVWDDQLLDTKPVCSVVFIFQDEAGDLRLTVSWLLSQSFEQLNVEFDPISTKWTRLERDTGDAASIIDVSLTDLAAGTAWHFDMQASQAVDPTRLSKTYIEFAASLKVDAAAVRKQSAEKCFAIYRPNSKLKSIHQRISYRYGIMTTDYTLEISRFQDRVFPPRTNSSVLTVHEPTVYEPRWSLQIYRNAWDTMFTDNERLDVGQGVEWDNKMDNWFPKDDAAANALGMGANADGVEQLMEMLKKIAGVVQEAKDEDLFGGMSVG